MPHEIHQPLFTDVRLLLPMLLLLPCDIRDHTRRKLTINDLLCTHTHGCGPLLSTCLESVRYDEILRYDATEVWARSCVRMRAACVNIVCAGASQTRTDWFMIDRYIRVGSVASRGVGRLDASPIRTA